MDFTPTDDQQALRASIRQLLARECGASRLRRIADEPGELGDLWSLLAATGVFALRTPEHAGGTSLGCAEAVLVFEELGAALVPGPVVWTHLAAELLPGAADGTRLVGGLERDQPLRVLEHPGVVDDVVVLDPDGVWLLRADELTIDAVPCPLDPLTPVAVVAGALPRGERIADAATAQRWQLVGRVLTAALLVGIASSATALATDYAKQRHQFGRAIGSFQAVKHLLADMLARGEVARAAVRSAGVHLDDPELAGRAARAVASAKIVATTAGVHNTKDCIQVHGGIGFTWEAHPHLLAKRAQVHASGFGDVDALAHGLFG